jgi:hypothetical protein
VEDDECKCYFSRAAFHTFSCLCNDTGFFAAWKKVLAVASARLYHYIRRPVSKAIPMLGVMKRALFLLTAACGCLLYGCGGSSAPPLSPPSITTVSITDGTIGAAYTQTIQATGETAPFSWSVSSGSLPHALALNASSSSSVAISGTPDTVQANVALTIQVHDANGQTASQAFSISIKGTT